MTTGVESLRAGLHQAFVADSRVHLLGEDIFDPYGGAFKVTQGLHDRFPNRVHTTPICEGAIVGAGIGLALRGLFPVIELMFGDFLTLAVDQLVNHASKFVAMYGSDVKVPLVVRTPMGGGRGYGPTHSQTLEKILLGTAHLKVLAPSLFHDPGKMLHDAILNGHGPVLFIENKLLYSARLVQELDGPVHVAKTVVDTKVVRNYQSGEPDVTLICYGGTSILALEVMKRLAVEEIRVETCVPGGISEIPIETLAISAQASKRVVVVDEATAGFGWASEVTAAINEACFGQLETPVRRVAAASTVIPTAKPLEVAVLPSVEKIESALIEVLAA